ncbi:MAG: putative lipoamide dehydrogenase [Acidimicrobiaceae bacterium]|nr:putative lipoamide dehydrogenase [Acidimicrobiaceae bacterium]
MAVRFVIVGGGPAGVEAAATASRLGADVTLVERDVIGGAANLWDCIPSKAMIATGGLMALTRRSAALGLNLTSEPPNLSALRARVEGITERLAASNTAQLESQGVRLVRGFGRLRGPHTVEIDPAGEEPSYTVEADAVLLSTGSTPRVPAWAPVDGDRVLITRDAYPPPSIPEQLVVVGSGVTGVEFVHLFRSLGSRVSLIVSRQQVLPQKDPEVAAALEADFLETGVTLVKGARAVRLDRTGDAVVVICEDDRKVVGSHVLLAIGSVPSSAGLGLEEAGVAVNDGGYVTINHHCQSNVPHIYAAGDLSGRLQLASVAAAQGRKVAEHVMGLHTRDHRHLDYDKAASAIFTEPEIADVGLAEAEAFALGRKIRVTKVPFALSAKAMIDGDPRGFVKLVSDPNTGIILGGSIVGAHAAELISVIGVAVSAHLRVDDLAETVLVHPALAEVLAAAAE